MKKDDKDLAIRYILYTTIVFLVGIVSAVVTANLKISSLWVAVVTVITAFLGVFILPDADCKTKKQ